MISIRDEDLKRLTMIELLLSNPLDYGRKQIALENVRKILANVKELMKTPSITYGDEQR